MGSREERVAKNEATAREINENIEQAHAEAAPDEQMRMLCECGHRSCERVVAITMAEYQRVRGDARRFVMVRDHVTQDVEDIVEETDRFVVVMKRDRTSADVAIETDPRR